MPAIVPSARREVMPEMNTRRPRASTMVAWEKWPDGWRILAEVICCLGMRLLLDATEGQRLRWLIAPLGAVAGRNGEPKAGVTPPDDWLAGLRLALPL